MVCTSVVNEILLYKYIRSTRRKGKSVLTLSYSLEVEGAHTNFRNQHTWGTWYRMRVFCHTISPYREVGGRMSSAAAARMPTAGAALSCVDGGNYRAGAMWVRGFKCVFREMRQEKPRAGLPWFEG